MRLNKWLFILSTIALICFGNVFASQNYAQQLQRISTDEGLSQSYVTKSLQDNLGFIWIATTQGLNRFDGHQVNIFDGGVGLERYNIASLFKTHDDKIIVSTESSGAYLIDPINLSTVKIYSGVTSEKSSYIPPILAVEQIQDVFYFAIRNQVFSFSINSKILTLEATIDDETNHIRALSVYKNDLFIGANKGLYFQNLANKQLTKLELHDRTQNTLDNNDVKFLSIDSQLGLLVGTVEGLYAVALDDNTLLNTSKISTIIPEYNIWDYKKTPYGEFIATEQGLFQYHRDTGNTEFILNFSDSKFNITENTINDLMVDATGMFWLASRTQGVFTWAIQTRRFNKIKLPANNVINTIYQDKDDSIWFGNDNGITHASADLKTSENYLESDDNKAVYGKFSVFDIIPAHLEPESQYLWLVRYYDLILFDKKAKKIVSKQTIDLEPNNPIDFYGFSEIANDTFAYFSNENFFIYNGKTKNVRIIKGLKEQIDPFDAYTFLRPLDTHPDELLISTYTHLFRYNEKNQTLTIIYAAQNRKGNTLYTIDDWLINNKILWLATSQEGLIGLDSTSYERKYHFDMSDGLKTESMYSLQLDEYGFLWISSQNGLYRLDTQTQALTVYTVKDGLSVNQFSVIGANKLNNGNLIFGSSYGAISFDAADFIEQSQQAPVFKTLITDITLLSRQVNYHPMQYASTPLALNHDDIGLEISFSNFDFHNANKTYYKVSLTGPTSLNYDNLKSNKIFFTKLPPGDYVLNVSSHSTNSSKINESSTLLFNIAYAPWQSPLAYTIYTLSIISILFLLFWQYRHRKITIENAHRATIHSQKQTELALRNNKSGVWDYDLKSETVNTLRGNELGYTNLPERIELAYFIALIHPDDRRRVESLWNMFIQKNEPLQNWQATYRLHHKNGHWLWYQDIGQIIYNPLSNEPLYVSGIYTNITEQRANEQQANVLGEAFSQINDWLLILDTQLMPFSANNSLLDAFSSNSAKAKLSTKLLIKAMGKAKCKKFAAKLKSLKPKQNWHTDTYIKTKKNKNHPIHLSVTAVAKEDNNVSYYVVVISDLTEQKRAENELRYLANYDPLTRLPNRSLMYQKIEIAIEKAQQSVTQCAILFIDLDKFKPVNDSFGHAVGDKLLCNIAERVSAILGEYSTLGRQSGDEFLVLIENTSSVKSLNHTVKEISAELANKVIIEDFSINISASIGVALYPFDAETTDILIRNADVAMMHAKQNGRNGFKFFNEKMNEKIKQKLILENNLKDAAKDNLFFNHYQPIVDIEAKVINGVELLMRWENDGQLISPAQFIPIAEETGLIEMLTEQALKRALSELAPILSSNPLFYISLNLSPKHILKENIAKRLLSILNDNQVSPMQLRLEITENTLLDDKVKAAKQLQKLQALGFKLLLDDFGTGYSSLTYLSQFPINVIKIDQSFVNSIGIDKGDESIIKSIFSLANNLELSCIAEGVETREQVIFLTNMGCYAQQGYYFAKPMKAEKLCESDCFNKIINLI